MIDTMKVWHDIVRSGDVTRLSELLAEDVVFHSPVVHTPQRGKAITTLYLQGALSVLNSAQFRYEREVVGERDAVLEFVTELDGVHVNGVDLIRWNDSGLIVDFKVMLRPLKALGVVQQKMAEALQRKPSAP